MIPLAVTAKNEEQAIGRCLESLLVAVECAEERLPVRFDVVVVLDDCTDATGEIARRYARVRTVDSSGGIVEAQRKVVGDAPFYVFSDADIAIEPMTLYALARQMLDNRDVQVAYPRKVPIACLRRTLLAQALYVYNRFNGFQTQRHYFSGRLFAIRDWRVPTVAELQPRLASLPRDRFYDYHAGVRVDDIYLSRDILMRYGPEAICQTDEGAVYYRPPETFAGMYRTYRRMRMEIERLDVLFPETVDVHTRYGRRGYDRDAVRRAARRDRWLWRTFRLALGLCRVIYRSQRIYYRYFTTRTCAAWQVIEESKVPISRDTVRPA